MTASAQRVVVAGPDKNTGTGKSTRGVVGMLIPNTESEGRRSAGVIRTVESHSLDPRNTREKLFRERLLVLVGGLHRVDDA